MRFLALAGAFALGALLVGGVYAGATFPQLQRALAMHPPLELTVRGDGDQLNISWTPGPTYLGAVIQITDGGERTKLFAPPGLSRVTYTARTTDIEIRAERIGDPKDMESVRYIDPTLGPTANPTLNSELGQFDSLVADARALRTDIEKNNQRLARIQTVADKLLTKVSAKPGYTTGIARAPAPMVKMATSKMTPAVPGR
jgi:hypothetical protein